MKEDPRIAEWRRQALEGTLTKEGVRDYIALTRAGRKGAAIASEKSRAKKRGPDLPDLDDMMKELEDL